jgi:hypothetical protein
MSRRRICPPDKGGASGFRERGIFLFV